MVVARPPRFPRLRRLAAGVVAVLVGLPLLVWLAAAVLLQPSNTRDWSPDQVRVAQPSIDGGQVRIDNVRNAHYRSVDDYDVRWETRHYDLDAIESVWFVVEPFADWRGPAHTFLSFGFAGGDYVAVSVEIRRERGESFSPLRGLLRQYELAYVIGDERDLIGLRAVHRRDAVYLYRMRATPAQARTLFVAMLARADALARHPEFYDTLASNCTSNIVRHIEAIAPGRIPWSPRTLLPGYSDDLAFDLGLIDTALPRADYRAAHRIDGLARAHAGEVGFSAAIRARIAPER